MKPEISVVLSVFNAEKYLKSCVDSILCQSFHNFELIVINDGSTDNSLNILKQYQENDRRIILVSQSNQGLSSSLNLGIALSKSEICARIDADDVAENSRLQKQFNFLNENPNISVVGSWIKIFGEGCIPRVWKNPLSPSEIYLTLFVKNPLFHPSVMFRKSRVLAAGGYDSSVPYDQDYDLWLRMSKNGDQFANIPQVLMHYRIHKEQMGAIFQPNTRIDWMHRNIVAALSRVDVEWDGATKEKLLELVFSEKFIRADLVGIDLNFLNNFIEEIVPRLPYWFNKDSINNFIEVRLLNYIKNATVFEGVKIVYKYKKFRPKYFIAILYGIFKKIKRYKIHY